MKSSLSVSQIPELLRGFLQRYHVLLFCIVALGGLIAATLALSAIAETSSPSAEEAAYTKFDETTIKQLDSLKTVAEQEALPFETPRGKRNPFVE